jgi:hypothetical protein
MGFVDDVTESSGYTTHKGANLPLKRLSELGIKGLNLFDDIDPCDVKQGAVGDCWLVSSIAAIAEFPGQIESLFVTKELSKEGCYTVRLFDLPSQEWKEITIDDRIAMYGEGSSRVKGIVPPLDGGAWAMLLEKAWVIHAGGWDKVTGGKNCLGFKCMTGCDKIFGVRNVAAKTPGVPHQYKMLEYNWPAFKENVFFGEKDGWGERFCKFPNGESVIGVDELFDMLCEWDAQDFLVAAATRSGSDDDATDGIVDGHAYTVLSARKDVCGKGIDLICFRNPHGLNGKEWGGAWSDKDALWEQHPDVAKELGHTIAADGAFWMAKEDAFNYYYGFFVSMQKMVKGSGRTKSKGPRGGTIDGIMGSYTSSKGGVKVTISLEDDAVRVNNPGYEKAYSIDDFYRGGNVYYYGLTGSVGNEDGVQVIHWSNGVSWTKTD